MYLVIYFSNKLVPKMLEIHFYKNDQISEDVVNSYFWGQKQ